MGIMVTKKLNNQGSMHEGYNR